MRVLLAAACLLVLCASAMPVSADDVSVQIRCTPIHYRSMCTNGTATSLFGKSAQLAQLDIRDDSARLTIGSLQTFTASWVKQRAVEGENTAWLVHVTGTAASGAVDLQGTWTPIASIDMCTASIPAYCYAQAEGPIALTGYVGSQTLDLAGIAFDTYSYTSGGCLSCELGPTLRDIERAIAA